MSVLIIGAGPAGLATALTLARYGVPVRIVERRTTLSAHPRATVVSTRTMELLRAWGVADAVRAAGFDAVWLAYRCHDLADPDGVPTEVGYPSPELAARHSPTAPFGIAQDRLEPILLDHLRTHRNVRVSLGTDLIGLRHTGDGVTAELRDASTGRTGRHRARYLIGADGAHSVVRPALGIRMSGESHVGESESVLFEAPLWPVVGDRRFGLYPILNPAASGLLLPAGGDRWLYGREYDHTLGPITVDLLRTATGVPDLAPRVLRTGRFAYAALVADAFRAGNGFLVGDAAHRISPRGGTGLNTAVQDGHDLGWRLAWALLGWADLLDGYEERRRPIAEHNAARSARRDGSYITAEAGLAADLDGRLPHAWTAPGVSTVDLIGPGLTMFTGPTGAAVLDAGPVPLAVHRLTADTARTLGIPPGGRLLVGPDGRPPGPLRHRLAA